MNFLKRVGYMDMPIRGVVVSLPPDAMMTGAVTPEWYIGGYTVSGIWVDTL